MQPRRPSDGGGGGGGKDNCAGSSSATVVVKMRGKDKPTSSAGCSTNGAPPPLRYVNRPYSCDVETLSSSPSAMSGNLVGSSILNSTIGGQDIHHPYFYNHRAPIRQRSTGSSTLAAASAMGTPRLNASYQQLTSVVDGDENSDSDTARQPPIALQEDFCVEEFSNGQKQYSTSRTFPKSSRNSTTAKSNYVNFPLRQYPSSTIAETARSAAAGSVFMHRSSSQSDVKQNDGTPPPSAMANSLILQPHHQELQHPHQRVYFQRSAAAYDEGGEERTETDLAQSRGAFLDRSSADYYHRPAAQAQQAENQYQRQPQPPEHQQQRRHLVNNAAAGESTREYGSSSSIDRLVPPPPHSSFIIQQQHAKPAVTSGTVEAFHQQQLRTHAPSTHSHSQQQLKQQQQQYTAESKDGVQQQHQYKRQKNEHQRFSQNVVVSVTAAAEDENVHRHHHQQQQLRQHSSEGCDTEKPRVQQPTRASLRRGKAVDESSCCVGGESTHPSSTSPCCSTTNSPVVSSSTPAPSNKDNKLQSAASSGARKGASILRKLIGGGSSGGSKNASGEDSTSPSLNMASGSAPTGTLGPACRSGSSAGLGSSQTADASGFVRPDFSSDSSDFKYDERVRRRIFSHYDCVSICADARPLLNGTSRLKDANLNAATGASQASRPFLYSAFSSSNGQQKAAETPTSPVNNTGNGKDDASTPDDRGDGKSNDLVLSCPFFRNECGAEPVRNVSLSRDTYQQQQISNSPSFNATFLYNNQTASNQQRQQTSVVDEQLETWHRPATAAEASVLENLSNVYLGGRLCAKRQPQLVIEHVDQGAFYYRHCFSGKSHQNYFGIDDNLGPTAISVVREKLELPDVRRLGLTSPYLYRSIIRLSDLSTFRGAILEESLPSYLSLKESREQQLIQSSQQLAQQSPGTPGSTISGSTAGGGASSATSVSGGSSTLIGSVSAGGSSGGKIPVKELLELTIPELQIGCLRLALPVPRTEELLLKLDEQSVYTRYKVGILLCRANQSTEEQMYNNEVSSPALDEFLDMLGQRVRLKGFDKYKGGLDCKGDTTGTYSLYTTYQQYEIMFHVSTLLPFTPQNRQQLSRKRHIGNDIVTVIFQEPGAAPFSPQTVRSHFQHVFIVVQVHNPNTDNVRYSVAVSRCKDVPRFGPPLPPSATFPKSKDFRDFLLTKMINAENAVHKSEKFAAMAARTRREFMRDLAENHMTSHTLEGSTSGKIASKLLGGTKRKDRPKPKLYLDAFCRGAIVWDVQVLTQVEDFSLCRPVECFLGISADNLVLIEQSNNEALFCTATHSVIGWTSHGNSLKLYYDHADVIILRTLDDDDSSEMQEIIKRLQAVTKGCETVEMILRRNAAGQLGFHIQHEGIVSDVEMYGFAWQAGLRQGSRLVEICKVSVATLTHDRMLELLRTSVNVRVLVIPPLLEDGSPRRGCEDPYCPAVLGDDSAFVAGLPGFAAGDHPHPPAILPSKHSAAGRVEPPSYETAMARRPLAPSTVGAGGIPERMQKSALTQSAMAEQSPEMRGTYATDHGYESGTSNTQFSSKSLDDIQNKRDRRHSEDIRSISADQGSLTNDCGGPATAYYLSTNSRSMAHVAEERWYLDHHQSPVIATHAIVNNSGPRTDTLSSSGSTASSEMSSDSADHMHGVSKRKPTRPSELKRKVDKANSDMLQRASSGVAAVLERTSTDPCSSGAVSSAGGSLRTIVPPLPPKTYRNKHISSVAGTNTVGSASSGIGSVSAQSSLSSSSSHLAVPGSKQRPNRASVQENLLRLIGDLESAGDLEEAIIVSSALHRTLSDNVSHHSTVSTAEREDNQPSQYDRNERAGSKTFLSPDTERGIEWSSLVNAATKAIEGMTQRAMSNNGSPELSSYQLRMQAAQQRAKLLEEKVDRLQVELDKERESKQGLEIEVLHLRESNKRLEEECRNAKIELKKFTEWFFNAVENTGQPAGPTADGNAAFSEDNNNRTGK